MAGSAFSRLSISYTKYIFWSGKMDIDFPSRAKIDALFDPYLVSTDQPPAGGEGSKPTHLSYFWSLLGPAVLTFATNTASQHTAFLLFNELIPMS
jgi:hypothetical protein